MIFHHCNENVPDFYFSNLVTLPLQLIMSTVSGSLRHTCFRPELWMIATQAQICASFSNEWGIETHDLVLVTDNASDMSLAAELGNFLHIWCYAHTLNLACQRALKLPAVARLLG